MSMLHKYRILSFTVIILLSLVGCSSHEEQEAKKDYPITTASGDIQDITNSIKDIPSFLSNEPEDIVTIYKAAAQHQNLLENIPCYCGCGESAHHKDNYDCFIHQNNQDGSVVWDDHGTKCNVCLEIAALSISEYENGKTISKIRNQIDAMYKEGYAEPTPTK